MTRVPREDWLASRDHDVYVAAIACCQSGDPSWCSAHEKCHNEGKCFPGGKIAHERRDLRYHVGELLRVARDLRRQLDDVRKTHPRALSVVRNSCPHCGKALS